MAPADVVRLHGMRFWGKHGVSDGERARAQPIDVDLCLIADCSRAAASDDLVDALDYDSAYRVCGSVVTERSFHLLEALARACLEAVFADRRIAQATIRVRKPRLLDGATPEIELTRDNPARV